jgi:uncharacterized protein (DUF433 family)
MTPPAKTHIEQTPGVCGGKPRITGHRIRVQDVAVWHEHLGLTADQIVAEHPEITLADVYAALAYYFDHRAEIQEDIRRGEAVMTELRSRTPSLLFQRLTGNETDADSVSSG